MTYFITGVLYLLILFTYSALPNYHKRKNFFFSFWLHGMACGILVPQPEIEPVPSGLEVWSLNSTRPGKSWENAFL